jgi:hypothetical protein
VRSSSREPQRCEQRWQLNFIGVDVDRCSVEDPDFEDGEDDNVDCERARLERCSVDAIVQRAQSFF